MEVSLKKKIKQKISSRIGFSLFLSALLMMSLTISDIHNVLISKEHDLKRF